MEFDTLALRHFMMNMDSNEYVFFSTVLVVLFLLVHLYSVKKEKKKLSDKIKQNVDVFQKAFDNAKDAMLILSNKNEIIHLNKSMYEMLALETKTLPYYLPNIIQIKTKREWIPLGAFLKNKEIKRTNSTLSFPQSVLKNMQNFEISINLNVEVLEIDKNYYYDIVTIQDLTKINQSSEMLLRHQLTQFPNQIKAHHELPTLFSKIHIENNKIVLILLSLDNLSSLRAMIGFEKSNELIIKFANYLNNIVSEMNVHIYHTFDNHFLLSVSNVKSVDSVVELVNEIQARLSMFYKIEENHLCVTLSSGIALYPDSGSPRTLLDKTYKALSQAEKEGNGKVIVYTSKSQKHSYDELNLHNDMQGGLDRGEFTVYYQPIVTSEGHKVIAAEALVRWMHPDLGLIPPDVFIKIMEKTGFIVKLGKFVLEEVLKQQKRWELFKFRDIEISINVSMVEIATGEFVEYVEERLRYHHVHAEKIKFEITEGVAMISEVQTEKFFHKLKKLGLGIALDDFGTGYTSFNYLKKFPADSLKIDGSLLDNIEQNKENQRIVHAMIELGHTMGMKVVVEGVETKYVVDLLESYGCDYMQGYYFSKPLPVFEFQELLRNEKVVRR